MANEQVGTGYVLIKPKLDEGAKAQVEQSGKTSGQGFGTAFQVAAGNIIASAVLNLANGAVEVFANAFSNYANYEQLVGGVETLFKDSADIVQRNAEQAFRTAGMSANDYMEQVTSFSASLLQGLGGDTEAAAAYADMAIRDMSDNANKMGTDMQRITDAYQGFAKQNYTMLDNLKLGYGGTKTEMQRLLADASKIAGVEFNIDNYNDVIEAIHVMQTEMGIAGTTSIEATETISGSINKLNGAWQNFLTGIFDENADLFSLGENLFSSIGDVLKNVVPRIGVLVARLIAGLPEAIVNAIWMLPDALAPTIEKVFGDEVGGKMVESLYSATGRIVGVLDSAIETVRMVLGGIADFLVQNVYPIVEYALDLVIPVVDDIMSTIESDMPVIQKMVEIAMNGVKSVIDVVWPFVDALVRGVVKDVVDVVKAGWAIVQGVTKTMADVVDGAVRGLQPLIGFVSGIFDGIKAAIENPMEAAKNAVRGIIDAIKGFFNFSISWPHIPLPHPYISPAGWGVGDLLKGIIPSIGVEWYAKGGIVDGATLIGAGEAGAEAIVPLTEPNIAPFADAVADRIGMGAINIAEMTVVTEDPEDFMRQLTAFAAQTRRQYA